jgi:hypothetical protein
LGSGAQASSSQHERLNLEFTDRLDLHWAVANPPILSQHRQPARSTSLQPLNIWNSLVTIAERIVMSL